MKVASTPEGWKQISNDFWNFPLCLGTIDGKLCVINCLPKSGSSFYNYKGSFSIVLMAVADARYMFTFVDVGDYGRKYDLGLFNNSSVGEALSKNVLDIPETANVPETTTQGNYCFIADEAFPLKENLQRPPGKMLREEYRIYNYRLLRARRVVENAFGILAAKW